MEQLAESGWQPPGARLVTLTLPVTFGMWDEVMAPKLSTLKPDIVVAFGLSAKATGVTLESTARNRVATDRPDYGGACAKADCISSQGPAFYPSSLPLAEIAEHLLTASIPVVNSDDAGDYICNLLFYKLMAAAVECGTKGAGFIHVPYLDTQVSRLAAQGHTLTYASTLTQVQLLAAAKTIIATSAAQAIT